MKEKIEKLRDELEKISDMHPYKEAGNRDSYSQYNEGWSDACDMIDSKLTEILNDEGEEKNDLDKGLEFASRIAGYAYKKSKQQ